MSLFTGMAYYVAKELHMRPNDILDTWGVPELIVAYGQYANEKSLQNYSDWKHLDARDRAKIPMPQKYAVKFQDLKD